MGQLSVIVPVYNNIKYLAQCIDSIISQEYRDMEIILVDDGSADGSGNLCDEYQKKDHRVQVIHKKNEGCMKARWCGLEKSRGKYIGFVDSDDWIAPDMYKVLMSVAKEKDCDIVSMGYTVVYDEQRKMETDDATLSGYYEKGKNLDFFLSNMMYDSQKGERGAQPSLCTKVIKRELLMQSFSGADLRITMGEDAAIFYPGCLKIKSIYITKEYKYFYRVHGTSMCRDMDIDTFGDFYLFYQYMEKSFQKYGNQYGLSEQLKKYVWTFLEQGIDQVFHIKIKKTYMFPYAVIERGSSIILYGAGAVGQSYYNQIMENHYCNIAIWTDKKNSDGKRIMHPAEIEEMDDMKVLVAVKKKEIADEIINELVSLGIDRERILWDSPQEVPVV